jgi:PAS domain S-box-containing protein
VKKNKLTRPGELSSVSVIPSRTTRDWTWTYVLLGTLGLMAASVVPLAKIQIEFALTLTALLAVGLAGYGWYLTRKINIAEKRISHLGTLDQNQRELTVLNLALSEGIEGITRLDTKGRFTYVNRAYAESIGCKPDEIIGRDWRTTIQAENHAHIRAAFIQMMKSGKAETTVMGRHRDGSTIYGELTMVAFRDERGQYAGHYGFTRNITGRKNAEIALQRSNERFMLAVRATQDTVYDWDIKSSTLWFSEGLTHQFGYPESGDTTLSAFFSNIHPEDHDEIAESVTRFLEGKELFWSGEYRFRRHDGTYANVFDRGTLVRDAEGKPTRMIGAVMDLTERKHAEQAIAVLHRRNEMILNSVGEGILGLDTNGILTSVNTAAAGLLGYEVEDLVGRRMHETLHAKHPDGKPFATQDCPIQATLSQGFFRTQDGDVFWRGDGTSIPVDYMCNPMFDESGKIMGAVVAFRDMTERYELDRIKSEFVSTVSHELRTPLTSIRGSLGLLASGRLGEISDKGQRMLDIAVANTDRLIRLINDILDIERLESGKVTLARKRVEVSELLDNTLELVRPIADRAGVTLRHGPIRGSIWADHDRITQTLTNLLSNAIKFSPRGSTISVTGTRKHDRLQFEVRDHGRGIPVEKLESIFDRFQQVDSSDAREKGGTGLGLAICRSIVQQHGGEIWAESTLGKGSTFYFTVPLAEPLDERVVTGARESRAVPKILIVEDDVDLARVIAASFDRYDALIYLAATGSQAIELAISVQPDLLVLDLVLPEMDGFSIVKWLRKDEAMRSVPVIVFSAAEVTVEEKKLLELGPTEFVTKSGNAPEDFDCKATGLLKNFVARGTETQHANSAH